MSDESHSQTKRVFFGLEPSVFGVHGVSIFSSNSYLYHFFSLIPCP